MCEVKHVFRRLFLFLAVGGKRFFNVDFCCKLTGRKVLFTEFFDESFELLELERLSVLCVEFLGGFRFNLPNDRWWWLIICHLDDNIVQSFHQAQRLLVNFNFLGGNVPEFKVCTLGVHLVFG